MLNTLKNGSLLLLTLTALAGCSLKLSTDKKSASSEPAATAEAKRTDAEKPSTPSSGETKPASTPAAPEGPMWIEDITGEKKKMARVDLVADVAGLSILAPEGAKVAPSPGGHGAEIEDAAYGYLVWVHEDPTATIELMKQGATAWAKDTKFIKEEKTSLILSQPSVDGSPAYYYKGIYKSGSKVIVCETPTSIAPSKQTHAEQIAKACDSLQSGGTSLVAAAEPAAEPASSASAEVAANDPPPPAAPPGGGSHTPAPQSTNEASKKAYADQQNAALTSMVGGTPKPPSTSKSTAGALRRPTVKKLH
ncbi:MAG: hypothetical protein U0414_20265 [Polyangiaceae bacterium]